MIPFILSRKSLGILTFDREQQHYCVHCMLVLSVKSPILCLSLIMWRECHVHTVLYTPIDFGKNAVTTVFGTRPVRHTKHVAFKKTKAGLLIQVSVFLGSFQIRLGLYFGFCLFFLPALSMLSSSTRKIVSYSIPHRPLSYPSRNREPINFRPLCVLMGYSQEFSL